MSTVTCSHFLKDFACIGAQCEDSCCIGWGMQIDNGTLQRYQSTELSQDITQENGAYVMKRNADTGACVRFSDGLCTIQSSRGQDDLGDACHFFPRITRHLGPHTLMSAALSCPEIARIAPLSPLPSDAKTYSHTIERLPYTIKDYLPDGMDSDDALAIHNHFLNTPTQHDQTAERTFSIISSTARSLAMLDIKSWAAATPFYLKNASTRLIPPEQHPEDPFNILHALVGLVDASTAKNLPRLETTISEIEKALEVNLNRKYGAITTTERSVDALLIMEHQWRLTWAEPLQGILKNRLYVQLANSLFPFAGNGRALPETITLLGMRFAIVRLALMSYCSVHQALPDESNIIRIVQGLSRFLDHLTSPELSLRIAQETGWIREPRLRALIGDM